MAGGFPRCRRFTHRRGCAVLGPKKSAEQRQREVIDVELRGALADERQNGPVLADVTGRRHERHGRGVEDVGVMHPGLLASGQKCIPRGVVGHRGRHPRRREENAHVHIANERVNGDRVDMARESGDRFGAA